MFASVGNWLLGRVASVYLATNGWKTIIGFVVAKLVALVLIYDPSFPAVELATILEYLGNIILTLGVLDRFRKNLISVVEVKK